MICDNISVNEKGHLTFAGYDTVELAEKYGTPLYLMDEGKIREHVRCYKNAMQKYFPAGSLPEFASKAFSCRQIYRIMAEEGIDIDIHRRKCRFSYGKQLFPRQQQERRGP